MNQLVLPLAVAALLLSGWALLFPPHNSSRLQTEEVEKIVENYLVENPEILIKMSQALQMKQRLQLQSKVRQTLRKSGEELLSSNSPFMGNEKGKVVLIDFFDYQCVHCKKMEPILEELVAENPDLKIIVKTLPIFGPASELAAKAALASAKQGKFKEVHSALINESSPLDKEKIMAIASSVGVDIDQLEKDMEDREILSQLSRSKSLAQQLSISGTPFFLLLQDPISSDEEKTIVHPGAGSKEQFQQMIDRVNN